MDNNELEVKDLFPSRYLKTEVGGDDLIVTIEKVNMVEIGNKREQKPVVYFKETPKVIVLNITNGNTLARLYGPKVANWVGKKISIYTIDLEVQGTPQTGVRIRLKTPLLKPKHEGEIPEFPEEPPDLWNQ